MSSLSSNPFALLGEDDAPAPAQPVQKPAAAQQQQKPAQSKPVAKKPAGGKTDAPRRPAANADAGEVSDRLPPKNKAAGKRDARRPRRGTRGGWHGHGREFDRHSGTLPDSDKKIKKGWGEPGEPVEVDAAAEQPVEGSPVEEVKEPEEEVKTLEEYLAEKASLKARNLPAPRKPNEGKEDPKWKNAVPLQRVEDEDIFGVAAKKEEASKARKGSKDTKTKQVLEIEQRFTTPATTRRESTGVRGRGARGGRASSGRGRGGSRPTSRGNTPNVKDQSAFPILA